MPYADRSKQLEYKRQWNREFYLKNKDSEKERIAKRKLEIANWFAVYKSSLSCLKCGETTTVCLDFHHLKDNKKEFDIALIKSWGWGKNKIKNEVDKCVVLCANCHRKIHAGLI